MTARDMAVWGVLASALVVAAVLAPGLAVAGIAVVGLSWLLLRASRTS